MIGIIDFGSSKVPDILKSVETAGYSGKVVEVRNAKFAIRQSSAQELQNFEKLILSGAPILLSQIEDAQTYVDFAQEVLELDIPILGICFGHQIIGMAHGSNCFMGEEDRAGQMISKTQDDSIFEGLDDDFEMQQDHCEYINLPPDLIHLGKSKITENEVMKHSKKSIYGCQFHPEVSGENGQRFIENFLNMS